MPDWIQRWKRRAILGLVCLFCATIGFWGLGGQSTSAQLLGYPFLASLDLLQEWQNDLDREQVEAVEKQNHLSSIEQDAKRYLGSLQHTVQVMDLQLKYYEKEYENANKKLVEIETKLNRERQTYKPKLTATIARLRFLQRQSLTSQGWRFLLKSDDLNEFFDRRTRLKLVYQADRKHLQFLQIAANKIKQQKQTIEEQKKQISHLQTQIRTQKTDLEAQVEIQQELVAQLNGDRSNLNNFRAKLAEDSQGIGLMIQKRMENRDRAIFGGTNTFIAPHTGKVSSKFGLRQHPIWGGKRLHSGIDFAGDYGSPVSAADSGTVILTQWYGGYGKTVVIDHGGGMTTLYGHLSKFSVIEGQPVKQGNAIAEVGSTGFSNGPHLHFEIRKEGQPIDPLQYLRLNNEQLSIINY
ncbi:MULTISPECIES: peptidoglycan DD-metalloendopeptidase family protein [Spirulina sp. CCY15215]|uniref:murein hydrolase activator EnvC family protein n=1 Tax=Spirulina sp. CCY15215 TaxID=2767591 RepID=UPI00194EBA95|nr:peptidoglycan DD-metalloendopeptidase family protein [Spirulina major]